MAKRQRTSNISASFHYLVKQAKNDPDNDIRFSREEFQRIVDRIRDTDPIDFDNNVEVERVKKGENIPFLHHEELSENLHFGCFEGAYYGQEYRNTRVGTIEANDLNLRRFHYLVDYRRDGKIVIGAQYAGNYGDYAGLKSCFEHILREPQHKVVSRTFSSLRHEIGEGEPIELKVGIRKQDPRLGAPNLFSKTGVIAIKRSDYGDNFGNHIRDTLVPRVRGNVANRKAALAGIIAEGQLMEIDDDDIIDCTLIMRSQGRQHTVYLLGDNSLATKFPVAAQIGYNGLPNTDQVRQEMKRILDEIVTPGLR